ncbi:ABC transporter substrate-binding protein [Aestuariibius sp. HNIBRBA575]|uniref:ABC transporter substrate-binding protein n=1 Tax=Aestuariibius sp. HNIBRBA575 TaxID=3233343 RepID=UPI0034A2917A
MNEAVLRIAIMPLVDAAPLIVAQDMGFAAEEGLALDLVQAPSWSALRDMVSYGRVEAAHMLSPVPIANALGLGGGAAAMSAVSVMSVNGNVIGVSRRIADLLRAKGYAFDFKDANAAGRALIGAGKLRIGVPFPFSMHAELLYYWLSKLGLNMPDGIDVRTVPPPLMAQAISAGEIDAFCVGEPWGSIAVENNVGELLLPGSAIWSFAPEKVLATRDDWAANEPELVARLIRAVWRAGRWLGETSSRITAAELLSKPERLNISAEIIDRSLNNRLVVSSRGDERRTERFVEFHAGAASFPWRSQAAWIGAQLASRHGLDPVNSIHIAKSVFRPDLHRAALRGTGADLPGANEKLEGAVDNPMPVAGESGKLFLQTNQFFDGCIFDPT